jgi:surface protein
MEEKLNTPENMDLDIEKEGGMNKFDFKISKYRFSINKKTAYIVGCGIILLILLIIIISVSVSGGNKNKDNSDKETENTCEKGGDDLCKTCNGNKCASCNDNYNLVDGVCVPKFDIKSIYISTSNNEKIILFNESYNGFITEMEVDGQKVSPSNNYVFPQAGNHTIYLSIKIDKLNSLCKMFYQIDRLASIVFTKKLDTKNITSMERMFVHCDSLSSIDMSHFNIENVENLDYFMYSSINLVSLKLPKSKASKLVKANHMFEECKKLTSIDFTNFIVDSNNLAEFHGGFQSCSQLEYINLTNFNLKEVVDMGELFTDCHSLKSIDFPDMKTNKLKIMKKIFFGCNNLKSLNLSNFNTENVDQMNFIFYNCASLESINLSSFNTKNVQNMNSFFYGCSSLVSLDLSTFNTEKVSQLKEMFAMCTHLSYIDISNFSNKAESYFDIFAGLPSGGTIKLNRNIYEKLQKYIPSNWEKKYVD